MDVHRGGRSGSEAEPKAPSRRADYLSAHPRYFTALLRGFTLPCQQEEE